MDIIVFLSKRASKWYSDHKNRVTRTYFKSFHLSIFIKGKLSVKVIFLTNKCLDLISIHHLRGMTRVLWSLIFFLPFPQVGRPAGCSGMIFFLGKKMFRHDTRDSWRIICSLMDHQWWWFSFYDPWLEVGL